MSSLNKRKALYDLLIQKNEYFEDLNPAEILYEIYREVDLQFVATSSFQPQSLPLIYLISKICSQIPILFLDTKFHFQETLDYLERITHELSLNVIKISPTLIDDNNRMFETDPNMCCYLRKVEPLNRNLKKYDIWISGIRRDQTEQRKNTKIIAYDSKNDILKVCPMANTTSNVIHQMNDKLDLPRNPLIYEGFLSVGCYPCTHKPVDKNDERSGRWLGSEKTECGLHYPEEMYEKYQNKLGGNLE